MTAPLWVTELAAAFWEAAGGPEPFPRDLRAPIARALPLAVVLLPRLRVTGLDAWLRARGIACGTDLADRPLRACLVARAGHGLVFLDGADGDDDQRFSLAHELAHFLRHYLQPRRTAREHLGAGILEVLDGERPPRHEERVHALLAGIQVGYHVHLMERREGRPASAVIERAEREADLLAFELLAPATAVLAALPASPGVDRQARAVGALRERFGFPAGAAQRYAAQIFPHAPRGDAFLQSLRSLP